MPRPTGGQLSIKLHEKIINLLLLDNIPGFRVEPMDNCPSNQQMMKHQTGFCAHFCAVAQLIYQQIGLMDDCPSNRYKGPGIECRRKSSDCKTRRNPLSDKNRLPLLMMLSLLPSTLNINMHSFLPANNPPLHL